MSSRRLINSPNGLNVFRQLVWLFSYVCLCLNDCLFNLSLFIPLLCLWKCLWFFKLLLPPFNGGEVVQQSVACLWRLFLPAQHLWPSQFCDVPTLLYETGLAYLPLKSVISQASELQDCLFFFSPRGNLNTEFSEDKQTKSCAVSHTVTKQLLEWYCPQNEQFCWACLSNLVWRSLAVRTRQDWSVIITITRDPHLLGAWRLWHSRSRRVSSLKSCLGQARLVCRSALRAERQGEEPDGRCGSSCCTGRCDAPWQCSRVGRKKGENTDAQSRVWKTLFHANYLHIGVREVSN